MSGVAAPGPAVEIPPTSGWGALAAQGIVTNFARTAVTEGLGLVVLIAAARVLSARDFGIYAIAIACSVALTSLSLGGLTLYLTRRRRPPRERAVAGLVALLTLGLAAVAAVVVVAVLVITGPGTWGWLALGLAIHGLTLPLKLPATVSLTRTMRFASLAGIQIAESLCLYACALVVLLSGAHIGFLGAAIACSGVTGAAVALGRVRVPRTRPSFRGGRSILLGARADEAFVVLFQASGALLFPALGLVGGVVLAGEARWALSIATPLILMAAVVAPVVFVPFSRLTPDAVGSATATMFRLFGVGVGLVAVAIGAFLPWMVPVVFGEQWNDSQTPAIVALCSACVVATTTLARTVIQGSGRVQVVLRVQGLTVLALLALCAPAAMNASATGVLTAYGAAHAGALYLFHRADPVRLPGRVMIDAIGVNAAACLVMVTASGLGQNGLAAAALAVACASIAFAVIVLALVGRRLREDIATVGEMLRSGADRSGLS